MTEELSAIGAARARGIALLIVVAVAAGAAGGALDRWWTARAPAEAEKRPAGPTAEVGPGRERRMVTASGEERRPEIPYALRSVDLTDKQREKVMQIMARWQPLADSLLRSVRPRIIEMDFKMRQEAMCVLTPKQRDDWMAYRRREHLSIEEGDQMLALVTAGKCPKDAAP